jgi:hypothetical protein
LGNKLSACDESKLKEMRGKVKSLHQQILHKIKKAEEEKKAEIAQNEEKASKRLHAENRNTLKAVGFDKDLPELVNLSKKYHITLKGGFALVAALLQNKGHVIAKKAQLNDVDIQIVSRNPLQTAARLQKEGYTASPVVYDKKTKHFKCINLKKTGRDGKPIDITVVDDNYTTDFITGFNSVTLRLFHNNKVDDVNYHIIPLGEGYHLGIDKNNPYYKDFLYAIKEPQKYLVAKYNPNRHEKYYLTVVKNYKKMIEIFGNVRIEKDEKDPTVAGDGHTPLMPYGEVLKGAQKEFYDLLIDSDLAANAYLEVNALIKAFSWNDPDVKPYVAALVKAMIEAHYRSQNVNDLDAIATKILDYLEKNYQTFAKTSEDGRIHFPADLTGLELRSQFEYALKSVVAKDSISTLPNPFLSRQIEKKKEAVAPKKEIDSKLYQPLSSYFVTDVWNMEEIRGMELYQFNAENGSYKRLAPSAIEFLINNELRVVLNELCIPMKVPATPEDNSPESPVSTSSSSLWSKPNKKTSETEKMTHVTNRLQ